MRVWREDRQFHLCRDHVSCHGSGIAAGMKVTVQLFFAWIDTLGHPQRYILVPLARTSAVPLHNYYLSKILLILIAVPRCFAMIIPPKTNDLGHGG